MKNGRAALWLLCIPVLVVACQPPATPLPATPPPSPTPSYGLPSPVPGPTVAPDTTSNHDAPVPEADIAANCAAPLTGGAVTYGTSGWWTDQDAELWRARYAELKPQVVRLLLVQALLEPANDDDDPTHIDAARFNFDKAVPLPGGRTATYRSWFETLRDLDITVMLYEPYLAGWLSANGDAGLYSTYPPRSIAEYGEFIEATLRFMIDEVGYRPEKIILEPVNEPDLHCGQDPAVPCFWQNWTMDDLMAVLQAARDVAQTVDPAIRMVGPSICCDETLVHRLMQEYDGSKLFDGLTYHRYERGFDQEYALQVGRRLANWGLPVYLNEYGSPKYWSDGVEGALWHAAALAQFWPAGIAPLQFPMSEFPEMHQGYNRLGLFRDWEGGWEVKPAYGVYVAFFQHLGALTPVSTTTDLPFFVAAGCRRRTSAAFWVVNAGATAQPDLVFRADGLSGAAFEITLHTILPPVDKPETLKVAGPPAIFTATIPATGVTLFVLNTVD